MKLKKIILFITIILIGVFFTLKHIGGREKDINVNINEEITNPNIAAWLVEWDLENGFKEIEKSKELDIISAFSVNFNERQELLISDRIIDAVNELKKSRDEEIYITIVNDVINDDGSSTLKSSELVRNIVTNDIRRSNNINNILELAIKLDVSGIDLDYEKVDQDIWDDYSTFIYDLNEALSNKGKKLRVVLEPKAPIEDVELPKNCEYIMMAYNLYGYHSGPGPKANKSFIKNLSKKMTDNLDYVRMAFSFGGFSWSENGDVISLSNNEVEDILKEKNIKVSRDDESFALYFDYVDESGVNNTVWYSDEVSIKEWIKVANECGINKIDFWKLGGNLN